MIEIDGSFKEGGGQILRTALSLSCLFNKPFHAFNIRKNRKKPGLMPQHLTCIKALQLLSGAKVSGDYKGSAELLFEPCKIKGGDFFFDIGTAGSTSLVLQTIIPSLILSKEKSTVILKGGTHVPFSPSFHYISEVFMPVLEKIGIKINLSINSYGFYPKGGGKIAAEIFPESEIKPLRVTERGRLLKIKGCSAVGNLPLSIAERQRNALLQKISSEITDKSHEPIEIQCLNVPTLGQGTFLFIKTESEHSVAGCTSLGERGKRAEQVGEDAASEFMQYYSSSMAFDPYLPDQIALYLSLCKDESIFTTSCITQHLIANLWVISLFCEYNYSVEGDIGKPGTIKIQNQ